MSEFTPLREAVDTLADQARPPDFAELDRRATRRGRRRVAMVAGAAAALIAGSAVAVTGLDENRTAPVEQPAPGPARNGWIAVDAYQGGGDIYLARPGEDTRRLEVAGADAADDACPAWSPDGTRLMFGRLTGSSSHAELVIVPVDRDGVAGSAKVIGLDGFEVLDPEPEGFDAHPCAMWAPDGRWVAFAGTGEVWVVDTQTGVTRRLPNLRPSDLEWRPGTDELAIAGDMGTVRGDPTVSTPVTVYSVSTGALRRLGSIKAAHITWSPDGTTLAYTGGEREAGTRELRLVAAAGTHERILVADMGAAIHGIGPEWSPAGDRIAYQRSDGVFAESHEVVLVNVADGTETVIKPPRTEQGAWYPFTVTWSPDGTTLLYAGWSMEDPSGVPGGVIAVPADTPHDATVLTDSIDPVPDYYSHRWSPTQMWSRQPE